MSLKMDERWQDLPEDLLEKVLQCLPIPTLYRFRTVCKKWSTLLTQPSFKPATLNTGYLFRTPNVVNPWPNPNTTTWELTDTTTQKRYSLDDTFLFDHVKHGLHPTQGLRRCTIAADKGLVCVLLLPNSSGSDQKIVEDPEQLDACEPKETLVVVNPVTKWCRDVVPFFIDHDVGFISPAVAMVVGDDMASFKIFVVLDCCVECPETERAFVFDSKLEAWHKFTHPPPMLSPCHMLKVGTILYTIFLDKETPIQHRQHELYGYNSMTNKWINTNVALPKNAFIPQLVVCLGRLFFVAFREVGISLWEIDLVQKKSTFLAEMEEAFISMLPVLPHCKYKRGRNTWSPYYPWVGISSNILALGSDQEYIVISSITGMAAGFNLGKNLWIDWLQYGHMDEKEFTEGQAGMLGCLMPINLGPSPFK